MTGKFNDGKKVSLKNKQGELSTSDDNGDGEVKPKASGWSLVTGKDFVRKVFRADEQVNAANKQRQVEIDKQQKFDDVREKEVSSRDDSDDGLDRVPLVHSVMSKKMICEKKSRKKETDVDALDTEKDEGETVGEEFHNVVTQEGKSKTLPMMSKKSLDKLSIGKDSQLNSMKSSNSAVHLVDGVIDKKLNTAIPIRMIIPVAMKDCISSGDDVTTVLTALEVQEETATASSSSQSLFSKVKRKKPRVAKRVKWYDDEKTILTDAEGDGSSFVVKEGNGIMDTVTETGQKRKVMSSEDELVPSIPFKRFKIRGKKKNQIDSQNEGSENPTRKVLTPRLGGFKAKWKSTKRAPTHVKASRPFRPRMMARGKNKSLRSTNQAPIIVDTGVGLGLGENVLSINATSQSNSDGANCLRNDVVRCSPAPKLDDLSLLVDISEEMNVHREKEMADPSVSPPVSATSSNLSTIVGDELGGGVDYDQLNDDGKMPMIDKVEKRDAVLVNCRKSPVPSTSSAYRQVTQCSVIDDTDKSKKPTTINVKEKATKERTKKKGIKPVQVGRVVLPPKYDTPYWITNAKTMSVEERSKPIKLDVVTMKDLNRYRWTNKMYKIKDGKPKWQCPLCPKSYTTKEACQMHISKGNVHTLFGRCMRKGCTGFYHDPESLLVHMEWHWDKDLECGVFYDEDKKTFHDRIAEDPDEDEMRKRLLAKILAYNTAKEERTEKEKEAAKKSAEVSEKKKRRSVKKRDFLKVLERSQRRNKQKSKKTKKNAHDNVKAN